MGCAAGWRSATHRPCRSRLLFLAYHRHSLSVCNPTCAPPPPLSTLPAAPAVNKMDQADESCGLDDEETRAYVAEIVTQQLNCPDFKLHPDQVG